MRLTLVAALGLITVSLAGACSNHDDGGLPAASSSSSAASSPPGTPSASESAGRSADELAAATAVEKFAAAVDAMSAGKPVDVALLRRYATKSFAQEIGENLAQLKAEHLVAVGTTKYELRSTEVQGQTATVIQCADGSAVKLKDVKAAAPPSGAVGVAPGLGITKLVKQNGAWLITMRSAGASCHIT